MDKQTCGCCYDEKETEDGQYMVNGDLEDWICADCYNNGEAEEAGWE